MRRWIALTLFGGILLRLNFVAPHLPQADDLVAIALAQGAVHLLAASVVLRDGPAPLLWQLSWSLPRCCG